MALIQARGRLESCFNGLVSSGTATTATGSLGAQAQLGERRNMVLGFGDRTFAIPNGHLAGSAWFLPQKAGGMSSVNEAVIRFTETGNAAQGYNASSAVAFAFSAAGDGAAVAAAVGSSTFTFTTSGSAVAPLNAVGSAVIAFSASANTGADASIAGTDAFSFSASATTGALGWMTAVPISQEVTAESIASAVWSEAIEGTITAAELVKLISAALAGKISGAGTSTVTIRDVNDTTNRIVATVDANGNRTAVTTSV